MKQKLQDFKLALKNDRRIWAIAGACLILLVIWSLSGNPSRKRRTKTATEIAANSPRNGATEAYSDLTTAFRQDIQDLKKGMLDIKSTTQRNKRNIEDYKNRSTAIFQTVVDKMEEISRENARLSETISQISLRQQPQQTGPTQIVEEDTLEPLGFETTDVPLPPPAPKPTRISVISPGDVVPLTLLTGVNAPVDGTPYPVVFKLSGPVSGPDGSTLDVGEARLIAAAQGSETDGRVLYRLTNLSIRHRDGRRSVVPVDGWIVGEDGKRGMKGKLIDKLGRLIATTAGVSFAAALGQQIDDKADAVVINDGGVFDISGNEYDVAAASALTDSANRLGEILLDRYEKLVPVVEVLSGRSVYAVFSATAEVDVMQEEDNEGIYASSLD